MNTLIPYLEQRNFLVKLGSLILLIAVFLVVTNVIGILIAIPFFGLDVFLNYGKGYNFNDKDSVAFLKYLQAVSQVGVFILPPFVYGVLFNRKPLTYLGLRSSIRVYPLFISVLILVVSIPFVNFLVSWNEQMTLPEVMGGIEKWMRNMEQQAAQMTDAFLNVNTYSGLMANLLIIGLLAALGEELLFRGVILKMLNESIKNIHLAVVLSAIVFSAFHGQFFGFVPRAALGILFGYIFIWTGSLWVPILLHLLFNSVTVVVAFLFETGRMNTNYEDFGESSDPWIVLLSLLFTISMMWMLKRKYKPLN